MEAGCAFELALRAVRAMEIRLIQPGTNGTTWYFGTVEFMVAKVEALDGLGTSVEMQEQADQEKSSKVLEAVLGNGVVGASNHGLDHGGGLFPNHPFRYSETAEKQWRSKPWLNCSTIFCSGLYPSWEEEMVVWLL